MLQKHYGQFLISAQIITSSVNVLPAVTGEGVGLRQRAERQVSPRAAAPHKSENSNLLGNILAWKLYNTY